MPGFLALMAQMIADSPTALWDMQDASGNPQDISVNGNHMTSVTGTPDYHETGAVPTEPGEAEAFGIQCVGGEALNRSTQILTAVDNFTVALLVDVENVTADDQLLFYNGNSGSNGWGVTVDANGQFQYLCGGVASGTLSGAIIEAKGFLLIHVVRRSGTWEYWVCGRKLAVNPGTTTPTTPSGTVTLGGASIQTTYGAVAVYNTPLSSTRIREHYRSMGRAFVRDVANDSNGATLLSGNIGIELPTNIVEDDMIIAHFTASRSGTITPPDSSWQRFPRVGGHVGNATANATRWIYYKRADGTEGGTIVNFNKSGTTAYYAGFAMAIGNVWWDIPFGFVRRDNVSGDGSYPNTSRPYKGALMLGLSGYECAVDTDEAANLAFTGTNAPHHFREARCDQASPGEAMSHIGGFATADYIDVCGPRSFGVQNAGTVTCDLALGSTATSYVSVIINSLIHAPNEIEQLYAAYSISNVATTTPQITSGNGTVDGVTSRAYVQLPGQYIWCFLWLPNGGSVAVSAWELSVTGRDFTQVANSPFEHSTDNGWLAVAYMSSLTEADCWQTDAVATDEPTVTIGSANTFGMVMVAYSGPNIEDVTFPDGTFEEFASTTAPDQAAVNITEDDSIVIVACGTQGNTGAVTQPSGYTERAETNTNFPKLDVADKKGVDIGTENPGAWTTSSGRALTWINFQGTPVVVPRYLPRVLEFH